jgi:CHAT domain-containing protein
MSEHEMARLTRDPIAKQRPEATPESLHLCKHPSFWADFILIGDPD